MSRPVEIKDGRALSGAIAGRACFVLFHSAWCPFCLAFAPAYDRLAADGDGVFLKVSTDDAPGAEEEYAVEVVPTVLYFRGGRVAARLDGELGRGLDAKQLRAFADRCEKGSKP